MTKHELIELTLEALLDSFKTSPECFEIQDASSNDSSVQLCDYTAILWSPKIELNNTQQTIVSDPNNKPRSVLVYYDSRSKQLSCRLYDTAPLSIQGVEHAKPEAAITINVKFKALNGNYRKFCKLRKLLLAHEISKHDQKFLKKLCSIFPAALDKHLLG